MSYLLSNKKSSPSGRLLAEQLGLQFRTKIDIKSAPAVRFGFSHDAFGIDTEINAPEVIKLCSDSVKFSDWCLANKVVSPVYTSVKEFVYPDKGGTFLYRDRWHRGGLDIEFIHNKEDFLVLYNQRKGLNQYIVPFEKTDYEVRIHVLGGEPVKLFLKKHDNPDKFPIRSSYKGWHYSLRTKKYNKAKELASKVANQLDLKFCAIDMAFRTEERDYIIWEINTAPGLNNETVKLYADYIGGLL